MYKNKRGEIVFKSMKEWISFNKKYEQEFEKSGKQIKCKCIRIHAGLYDILFVKKNWSGYGRN